MLKDYLTPSEILKKHPEMKKIWDQRAIGYLLMLKLVPGRKIKSSRSCIVLESAVINLFNIAIQNIS